MQTRLLVIDHNGISKSKGQKTQIFPPKWDKQRRRCWTHWFICCPECSGMMLAKPRVNEAASMDVAWMLACRPLQWQSCLLHAAMGSIEPADLIKISWWTRNSVGGCTWPIIVLFVLCYVKISTILSALNFQWFSRKTPLLNSALDKLWR